ncbi:hypothetical protein [Bartonella raoultii]|uniref:hypothetical protein n=1 Tax=Bartonella raoultii TaxID=1457020 RepID=UPI001ABAC375|nr:hypothetical protein [Bartonella raoultii]
MCKSRAWRGANTDAWKGAQKLGAAKCAIACFVHEGGWTTPWGRRGSRRGLWRARQLRWK